MTMNIRVEKNTKAQSSCAGHINAEGIRQYRLDSPLHTAQQVPAGFTG